MSKAVYAGSFDPLTNGHMNIIKRASAICDNLTVLVVENINKDCMFSIKDRVDMVKTACLDISNVSVDVVQGLLADYVNSNDVDIVVRGLRDNNDFEYELQMAQYNADLYKSAETIFLMTSADLSYISSSGVREIAALKGDISNLVPDSVRKFISAKMEVK